MKLFENDPVRTLFGDDELPAPNEVVLRKVLNDNLVMLRTQDLMARAFAARGIAQMHESEVAALRKRITLLLNPAGPVPSLAELRGRELAERAKAPKPNGFIPAKWTLMVGSFALGHRTYFLVGKCDKCKQEVRCTDVPAYFEHCRAAEAVPEEAVKQLRRAQGPMPSSN